MLLLHICNESTKKIAKTVVAKENKTIKKKIIIENMTTNVKFIAEHNFYYKNKKQKNIV